MSILNDVPLSADELDGLILRALTDPSARLSFLDDEGNDGADADDGDEGGV